MDKPEETESTTFVLSFFCKSVHEISFSLILKSSFYLIFSLSMIKKFCLLNTIYLKIKENSCMIKMFNKIKEIENFCAKFCHVCSPSGLIHHGHANWPPKRQRPCASFFIIIMCCEVFFVIFFRIH